MAEDQATDERAMLEKLVEASRFAMLTTVDSRGHLVSRPMTVQEHDGDRFLFITQRANEVAVDSDGREVNLSIVGDSSWVSLAGTGSISDDVETKKRLWSVFNDAYTEGGPENPDNVVLTITMHDAEYWDSPGGVATLLGVAKARITGGKPPQGEHGTVAL